MKSATGARTSTAAGALFTSFAFFTSLLVCASIQAQSPSQKPPIFRSRIDLVQLDVTVLDKQGVPVRGLTQADFTLLEDRKPQTIEGFKAIDLPERAIGGPVWDGKVTPDVTTNEIDNARLFVLVIDDGFGMAGYHYDLLDRRLNHTPDPGAIKAMKQAVEAFINTLGPQDLAGLVFTGTTAKFSQNLTGDRAKLLKALNHYPDNDSTLFLDPGTPPRDVKPIPQCLAHKEILQLVYAVVGQLASLPDRRKSILYFGGQMPWAGPGTECGTYWMWHDVFAAAQQGSVTINPIQTAGLGMGAIDPYLSVAGNTGGHAVVNTNDFVPGIKRIFLESSSYYLIAYQPTKDIEDGTFRQISVKVRNRPDVEVITKKNYWAPRSPKPGEPELPQPPAEVKALAGLLPDSRLALRVTAAAFAIPGSEKAVVTLALGVRQPAFANRTPEQIDLLIRSFTTTGDPKAGDDQTIPITVPAAPLDRDITRYEVLARIDVAKPGPYHLRLSAHSGASGVRGSVYVDVEVPDFRKEKVSLSGVILNSALSSTPVAPPRLLRDVTPMLPTTERAFATTDAITAFVRVYQGGDGKLVPIPLKTQIQDADGKSVFTRTDTLDAARFDVTGRATDHQSRLPLIGLPPGIYLLTLEASLGKTTVRRDVAFEVIK